MSVCPTCVMKSSHSQVHGYTVVKESSPNKVCVLSQVSGLWFAERATAVEFFKCPWAPQVMFHLDPLYWREDTHLCNSLRIDVSHFWSLFWINFQTCHHLILCQSLGQWITEENTLVPAHGGTRTQLVPLCLCLLLPSLSHSVSVWDSQICRWIISFFSSESRWLSACSSRWRASTDYLRVPSPEDFPAESFSLRSLTPPFIFISVIFLSSSS